MKEECLTKQNNKTELEKRLKSYMQTDDFQLDIALIAEDYYMQGLPVPPKEQLRAEAISEARKSLKIIMTCEAKGHLWSERADPENGTSELTCRRCGKTEHLQWL